MNRKNDSSHHSPVATPQKALPVKLLLLTILACFGLTAMPAPAQTTGVSDQDFSLRPFVQVWTRKIKDDYIAISLPAITSIRRSEFRLVVETTEEEEPTLTRQALETAASGEDRPTVKTTRRTEYEARYVRVDRTSDQPLIFFGVRPVDVSIEAEEKVDGSTGVGYASGAVRSVQSSVPFADLLRSRSVEEIGTLLSDTGASDLMEAFEKKLLQQRGEESKHKTTQDAFDHRLDRTHIIGLCFNCIDGVFESLYLSWTGLPQSALTLNVLSLPPGPEYFGPGSEE